MNPDPLPGDAASLIERIRELEARLEESEDTLKAIRRGDIDALVVGEQADEQRVYTLESADRPYRVLIEHMQEGAVTLGEDGTVLYCNRRLAALLGIPQERVVGQMLRPFVAPSTKNRQSAAVACVRKPLFRLTIADTDKTRASAIVGTRDVPVFDRLLAAARHAGGRSELTLNAAGGTQVPVYISLSLLHDGDTTLLCGVLTDLTEQKLHLRELAEGRWCTSMV